MGSRWVWTDSTSTKLVYVLPLFERIDLRMYLSTIHHKIAYETNEYSFILVTILKMSAVFAGPLK
jgi:hypothetical protein